jgi:hydrogenase-1 operon protein HyaF
MSSLDKIGVKVVSMPPTGSAEMTADITTGNALPLLHEIAALAQALADKGEEGCIDLRSLPLAPGDYEHLRSLLGEGEARATVDVAGETIVRETAYAGVWWVTYYGADEEVVADRIEITLVPAILKSHPADIGAAAERLRRYIAEAPGKPEPEMDGEVFRALKENGLS